LSPARGEKRCSRCGREHFISGPDGSLCPACRQEVFSWRLIGDNPRPVDPSEREMFFRDKPKEFLGQPQPLKEIWPRDLRVVRSCCFSCNCCCEVLVYVDDTGQVVKVEGDPDSPVTGGVLCSKGLAAKKLLTSPRRIPYPMVKRGSRASGNWDRVSWDEALDLIASKLIDLKDRYGPESIAFLEGTRRGWSRVFSRLANSLGAVNAGAPGWAQCLWPRLITSRVTFGSELMEVPDYPNSKCILVWGKNPPATYPIHAREIMAARARGAVIITVDPVFSKTAAKSDLWLQLRPGTDTALALGMAKVIIEEGLYDEDFVRSWTVGFDKLAARLGGYSLDEISKITWVPKELIQEAARVYALSRPASVSQGVTLDQTSNPIQTCRSLAILVAITGNVDVPGGNIVPSRRGEVSRNAHSFIRAESVPRKLLEKRLGYKEYPLLCGELAPVPSVHMPSLWRAVITEEPYPIRGALIFGSNVLVSYANSSMVEQALKKLEFIAVADVFMTPTADLADIIFPASSWLERNNVISSFQTSREYTLVQQAATRMGEARSDFEIIFDLGKRLGIGEYFWETEKDFLDHILEPVGLTFDEFTCLKRLHVPVKYRSYLKEGFKTPSGKVELYSSVLEKNGLDPLPSYHEPFQSPLETPGLAEEFPLVLTTGGRVPVFRHSEFRHIDWLRERCPFPIVQMHPATAKQLGIKPGTEVVVETPTGSVNGIADVTEGIHPSVVQVTPGWWGRGNINKIVQNEWCAPGIGTTPMRGLLCRVSRVKRPVLLDEWEGLG